MKLSNLSLPATQFITAVLDNTRPAISKTSLDFGIFCNVGQNLICVWWISIRFVCYFKVPGFWTSEFACFTLYFLPSLYRNMASLNSQGEIVLIELPNPGETQIWEGENELVRSVPTHIYFCSFCSWLPLFFYNEGLDAMVKVWLTSKRNPKSWNVFDDAGRVLSETAVNDKESVDLSSTTLG